MAEEINSAAGSLEKPSDTGLTPSGVHKRWMLELKLAGKDESEWRKAAREAVDIYEGKKRKAGSFNILWANTETLRPALYNSLPIPDVRKRWDEADEAGSIASTMLERALTYSLDAYGADSVFKLNALDAALPGRAIARVRYIPAFAGSEEGMGEQESQADEITEGEQFEELAYEQCVCEHVQWEDFRRGPGRTWDEVQWVAFRHRLGREPLVERFGQVGEKVELDAVADEEVKKAEEQSVANVFKTAEVWEVWHKEERKVYFLAPSYKEGPLTVIDDPLGLIGFFPIPEPLYVIEKSDSLTPGVLYSLYREQAEELNLISSRINKITSVLKYRGVYDSTLSEISKLASSPDNSLIPTENAGAWADKKLSDAIWFMPIEEAAKVLAILIQQREACKQTIYELTGMSDIVRGSSNAQETARAQEIKAQFGTLRLQRMQKEMQRYVRDVIRMMAEVIAEKFQPQTLMLMSGIELPTEQDIAPQMQSAMLQWQQVAMQAQQAGQPAPERPQPPMTIDRVMQVLRSDMMRSYRIDIETDSTIQALEGSNQQAIAELVQGIGTMAQSFGVAIQSGIFTPEAAQAIVKSVVRKFRLGRSVEQALDKAPQGNPQAEQMQQQLQQAQGELQQQAQMVQEEGQKVMAERQKVDTDRALFEKDKKAASLELENKALKIKHETLSAEHGAMAERLAEYERIFTQAPTDA